MANFIMLLAVSSILKKALTHFLAQQKLIVIEKKSSTKNKYSYTVCELLKQRWEELKDKVRKGKDHQLLEVL